MVGALAKAQRRRRSFGCINLKLLVFGRNGQVAKALADTCAARKIDVVSVGRNEINIQDQQALLLAVSTAAPDVVINAAAYTAVDLAEDNRDAAFALNRDLPASLARICQRSNIPLVHISTDYVFDGTSNSPWREGDETHPIGVYGASKLSGEHAVVDAGGRYVVLRTSWVFSITGSNFVKTMLRLAETRDELTVVADQFGGPTSANSIAEALVDIANSFVEDQGVTGFYHYCGEPKTSWANFAEAIFDAAKKGTCVTHIPGASYPTKAKRPEYSVLNCEKILADYGISQSDWHADLLDVVKSLEEET